MLGKSQRRGESGFLLKFFRHQLHPTARGSSEGKSQAGGKWHRSLVNGWFLPSRKYKEMKTHQNRMPFHASGSYLTSNACSLVIGLINRHTWPSSFRTLLLPLFLLMNTHWFQGIPLIIPVWHVTELQLGYLLPYLLIIEDLHLIINYYINGFETVIKAYFYLIMVFNQAKCSVWKCFQMILMGELRTTALNCIHCQLNFPQCLLPDPL